MLGLIMTIIPFSEEETEFRGGEVITLSHTV